MSIQVRWNDDSEKLVHFQFIGKWTLDDLYEALAAGYQLQNSKDFIVDMIFDMTQSNSLPPNIMSINSYVERNRNPHSLSVVITKNAFVRTMADTFTRLTPQESYILFAKDYASALEELAKAQAKRAQSHNIS